MDTPQSASNFCKALAVFDQHAPEILEIDLIIRDNKVMHTDLLNMLSLGEGYDDPHALALMADKLPAMFVFYGTLQIEADDQLASITEDIELFIQEKWQDTLERLTHRIDALSEIRADGTVGKKIPASLKSAPTKDGIRAAIMLSNKAILDDLNARRLMASQRSRTLANFCKGIEQRIRLLNSQMQSATTMMSKGIGR